jgi:hypothetical protein
MSVGRLRWITEGGNMDCVPEEWSPDFGRYMHIGRSKKRLELITGKWTEGVIIIITYARIAGGKVIHFANV